MRAFARSLPRLSHLITTSMGTLTFAVKPQNILLSTWNFSFILTSLQLPISSLLTLVIISGGTISFESSDILIFLQSCSSVGLSLCFCVRFICTNVCFNVWSSFVVPSKLQTAPVMDSWNCASNGFKLVDTPTGALHPPPGKKRIFLKVALIFWYRTCNQFVKDLYSISS